MSIYLIQILSLIKVFSNNTNMPIKYNRISKIKINCIQKYIYITQFFINSKMYSRFFYVAT